MKRKAFTRKSTYLAALAALLIASFVAGTLATSNQPVDAQGVNPLDLAAPTGGPVECTIGGFGTSNTLLLLQCTAPAGYLGYPMTSPAEARTANRYLATLLTAYALNHTVLVTWDDVQAHAPAGCPAPCWLLTGLGLTVP